MEGRYRGLLEAAPDAMVVVNEAGDIVLLNLQAEKQFGYPRHELVGQPVKNIIPDGFAERLVADDLRSPEDALAQQIGTGIELTGRRKDGSEFPIELMLSPLASAEGILVTAAIRDISVRKVAEKHLAQMDGRYRGLLEAAPDAMVVVNEAGVIILLNLQAEKQFGYPRDELVGQPVKNIIPDGFAERLVADDLRSPEDALAQQIGTGIELTGRRKDSSEFPIELMLSPLESAEGILVTAAVRDISVRKAAEQHLSESEDQLRQAQKMEAIGNLTGGMAHDFNNLLGIIIGNLDLLRDRQGADPDADELSREALDAALRGADLTRRLLAFARRQPLKPARTDVNALIAGIVRLLERTLGEETQITLDLDPEIWPVIVDPAQLESSLTNLGTNARDAMPGGGQLRIATGNRVLDADYASQHAEVQSGDYVIIEISDSGTGMALEIADHVFEPFFTTKELGKGTGLGLSMVFGFIRQSGGHVSLYSEVGIGTIFRLYLPRAKCSAEASAAVSPAALVRGSGETVLAVEDNPSLRRVVVRQLTELGYRVLEAEDAASALHVLESDPVDLLFTDVVIPGGTSGYDIAHTALARWPAIKIILTSGFPEHRIAGDADAAKLRLLSKPYRRDDLGRMVREVLDS
ncbi:MAG: PAS domain S-box protein [Stellaceae bacterium]